jgi:DNA polymerase III subunit gamma/tau
MYSLTHRGQEFDDIFGHDKIVNEFKRRSVDLNFPDVMILSGLSGSGKTTMAFVIAKLLNCKNPTNKEDGYHPCGVCESCIDVQQERFARDVYFKNASEMGKDAVNDLGELVNNYPMYDKNVIVIIDEAQLLGSSGKGATLKLLEKKRQNVYFILCTMDANAFDISVKRRGQVYNFKEVDVQGIALYLKKVLEKEGLYNTVPEEFIPNLFFLAENSYGSPGYAVSLLERCIKAELWKKEEIVKELNLVTDAVSSNILFMLLDYKKEAFEELKNIDLKEFYLKSCKILREAMVYKLSTYCDNDWKIANAKQLISFAKFDRLYQAFMDVKIDSYFNENAFYEQIIKFFYESKFVSLPLITEQVQGLTKRRVPK